MAYRSSRRAFSRIVRALRDGQGDALEAAQEIREAMYQRASSGDAQAILALDYLMEEAELEVGMYGPYAGSALPENGKYLWCDGSVFDPAAYPELAAVVGGRYNVAGDAAAVRRTPPIEGAARTVIGTGESDQMIELWTPGMKIGAQSHALTSLEMPGHAHGVTVEAAGSHSHSTYGGSVSNTATSGAAARVNTLTSVGGASQGSTNAAGAHAHAASSAQVGGGQRHNNMPPSLVSRWIIRAKP